MEAGKACQQPKVDRRTAQVPKGRPIPHWHTADAKIADRLIGNEGSDDDPEAQGPLIISRLRSTADAQPNRKIRKKNLRQKNFPREEHADADRHARAQPLINVAALAISIYPTAEVSLRPVPKAHRRIAQRFQRWARPKETSSPAGTAEPLLSVSAVPSGLGRHGDQTQRWKRWAILGCPSWTKCRRRAKSRHWFE